MSADWKTRKIIDEPIDDLDEWTTGEKLALAIFVQREGSQNWGPIARHMKSYAAEIIKLNRPTDWYSAKFCALQYNSLFEEVESLRKKRGERGEETTIDLIVKILKEKRKKEMAEVNKLTFAKLFKTYDLIRNLDQNKSEILKEIYNSFNDLKQTHKKLSDDRKLIEEKGFGRRQKKSAHMANKRNENFQKRCDVVSEPIIETNNIKTEPQTSSIKNSMEDDNIISITEIPEVAETIEVEIIEEKIVYEDDNINGKKQIEIIDPTGTVKIESNNDNDETVENGTISEENETEINVTSNNDETDVDEKTDNTTIEIEMSSEIKNEHNDEVVNITATNTNVENISTHNQERIELNKNTPKVEPRKKKRKSKNVSSIIKTRSNRSSIVKNETSEASTTEDENKESLIKETIKCEINEESNPPKIMKVVVENPFDLKENKKAVLAVLREAQLNLGPTITLINQKNPYFHETMDINTMKRKIEGNEISSEEFETELSRLIQNIMLKYDILDDDIDIIDYAIDAFEKLEDIKEGQ